MPAYLIAGLPGAGKSSVTSELKNMGYATIEGDDDLRLSGFARCKNGHMVGRTLPEGTNMKKYMWAWRKSRVREIISEAADEPVFLGGNAARINKYYKFFPKVFALIMEDDLLMQHLETRTQGFGSTPADRARIVSWNGGYTEAQTEAGAILIHINADWTARDVADTILSNIGIGNEER